MLGSHTIKSWSSTQSSVALSSGEAEFNGVVRGSGVGLGYQSLLNDLGIDAPLRVWTDSSAAIGICSRQGLGGVRHLDTHTLWVQQAVRCRRIDLRKVHGDVNPADIFTKHAITRDRLMKLVNLFDCAFLSWRAESAPQVRASPGTRVTMADANVLQSELRTWKRRTAAFADEAGNCGRASGDLATVQGAQPDPLMPHQTYDDRELDENFPQFIVPDDDGHDHDHDGDDTLLKEGNKIAQAIAMEARTHGRRKVM